MARNRSVIRIYNGEIRRGGESILKDIDMQIDEGDVVGIIGDNGSGKSTLLGAISGSIALSNGSIQYLVGGATATLEGLPSNFLTHVPQVGYVYETLTISENIRVALGCGSTSSGANFERAVGAWCYRFPEVGMNVEVSRLSAGEARYLSIVCGLYRMSAITLFDEPSAGLSEKIDDDVMREIVERGSGTDRILVIAEQKEKLVRKYCTKIITVIAGGVRPL